MRSVSVEAFDGDAAGGEPGDRAVRDADGGALLVGVDFGAGDPGVVVEDGVRERGFVAA